MYVTTLPVPGMHFKCSPKVNFFWLLFHILICIFSPCPAVTKTVSNTFSVIVSNLKIAVWHDGDVLQIIGFPLGEGVDGCCGAVQAFPPFSKR